MKIDEIRPGGRIELIAKIKSIQPLRKIYKCNSCQNKGSITRLETYDDKCPNCGEQGSSSPGKGVWFQDVTSAVLEDDTGEVYLDLWKEDTRAFKEGETIHLINGFAKKSNSDKLNVSKGKFGSLVKVKE